MLSLKSPVANFSAAIIIIATSAFLNLLLWAISYFFFPRDEIAAVLHYNVDIGIDFMGEGQQIMILPTVGLTAIVLNAILGYTLYRVDRSAAWAIWSITPLIQLILIGAFFLIRQANF